MNDEAIDEGFIPEESLVRPVDDSGFIPEEHPTPSPDLSGMKKIFEGNLKKSGTTEGESSVMDDASKFFEDVKKGWGIGFQGSATGLASRGKLPEELTHDEASTAAMVASGIGQFVGDLPVMIPSLMAGAVTAGPIGAVAASAAAPAAVRSYLMDKYKNGEIKSKKDFVERASSVLWETTKETAVGLATMKTGQMVAPIASKLGGGLSSKALQGATEVATMATVGSALEGELPDYDDFTVAGLTVGTMHVGGALVFGGTKKVSDKAKKIYAETGVKPDQVVADAANDPVLVQEMLIDDDKVPEAYKDRVEKVELPKTEPEVTMKDVIDEPLPDLNAKHPAVREVLDRISDKPELKGEVEKFVDNVSSVRQRYIDRADPIKKFVEQIADPDSVPAGENPYNLKKVENDYIAKSLHSYEKGTLDQKTLEINGKGLKEIETKAKDLDLLDAFLVAQRELDYKKRGLKIGFDEQALHEIRKMGEKRFSKIAPEVTAWGKRNLKYYADSGMISQEAYKQMDSAGEYFVPIRHIMDDSTAPTKSGRKGNVLKRVKGAGTDDFLIESPLVALKENDLAMKRAAERNRANLALVDLAEKNGLKLEKVEQPKIAVDAPEVKKFLDEAGIKAEADGFKVWRTVQKDLGPNEIEVFRDGKREVYKLPKDAPDGLAEAMKAYGGDYTSTGLAMQVAQGVTKFKKAGITITPAFKLRNYIIDQLNLGLQSKDATIPFVDSLIAVGDIMKKNDHYYRWLKSGGVQGSFLKINDGYFKRNVIDMHEKAGVFDKAWNVLKSPADFLATTGQILENSSRLAEFKRVSKGASSGERVFAGGAAAREVTVDFEIRGNSAKLSFLNSISAFLNPTIQGVDKSIRAFKENPVQYTTRGAIYITAPTLALYWANKGDPRYEELPQWRKDLFWNVPTDWWVEATDEDHAELMPEHLKRVEGGKMYLNKGYVVSIPRPHLPGLVFGAAFERGLDDFFDKEPNAWKDFDEAIVAQITPNLFPDVALPAVEQWGNKNFFTGKKLIPQNLMDAAPELQYTNYTSETAKQLAKITPHVTFGKVDSPIIVDNYIKSWGGPVGQMALGLLDKGLEEKDFEKPTKGWFENPMVGSFIARNADMGADSISEFYDHAARTERALKSFKTRIKRGLIDDDDDSQDYGAMAGKGIVRSVKKSLATHRKIIAAIYEDKEMKGDEKRQLIDGQTYMMIEETKFAVEQLNEIDKQLKQSEDALIEQVATE